MVVELVQKFRKFLSEKSIRVRGLNYSDRSIGLRVPDSPTGILLQDNGILQLYAAKAKFVMTAKGLLDIDASQIELRGQIKLDPPAIQDLKIMNKYFNPDIFNGQKIAIVQNVDNLFVVNASTTVKNEKLVNTTPLNKVITSAELFIVDEIPDTIDLDRMSIIAKAIGKDLPKWTG